MKIYFEWTKEMSVDEEKIDGQHQKLLTQVNKIIDALFYGISSTELTEAVDYFNEYISEHFSYEEEYMKKIGYPNIDDHIKKHKDFISNYEKIKDEFTKGVDQEQLVLEMEKFVGDWWVEHIGHEDQGYHQFMISK
jgi:hemerythrin-like metal-binding protein